MSGLEKFHASEAWRERLKNFILMERNSAPRSFREESANQRYSLDIDSDFKNILEQKSLKDAQEATTPISKPEEKKTPDMNQFDDDKENNSYNVANQQSLPVAAKGANAITPANSCDETIYEDLDLPPWMPRDESFEVMEQMCNKSASDPNSTLFKYLHSDDKEKIIESVKQRSGDERSLKPYAKRAYDEEANALQRLLDELRVEEENQLDNESPLKGVDETQLEDIEAPSRLWENTITSDTVLQTSPVKMVGLLRPSTIIEEGDDESGCSEQSSQMSFKSAFKTGAFSEVSSSCYETAHDSTTTSCATSNAGKVMLSAIEDEINKVPDAQLENISPSRLPENLIDLSQSVDLIDLEKTFAPQLSNDSTEELEERASASESKRVESDSDESITEIVISSDDDDSNDPLGASYEIQTEMQEHIKFEKVSVSATKLQRSSVESAEDDANKENAEATHLEASDEKSMHFNDTMEEVEYMMKKGMEYMAAAQNENICIDPIEVAVIPSPDVLKAKQNTFLVSPKKNDRYRCLSPMLHKQKPFASAASANKATCSPLKPITKPKLVNRFALDMKPIPKLDLFKKPTALPMPTSASTRHKDISNKHFSHIVSPVGAYMKKTATRPLMTTIKNKDAHNATVFRELEFESRSYQPKFENSTSSSASDSKKLPTVPCGLPKKAYISSEYKHIVDERTPITIPGGNKIQKYLESAMLPAVLRHEGKIKMPTTARNDDPCASETSSQARRNNASLADLSVMSGDVSMYTIRDAQKF